MKILADIEGISIIRFDERDIVRHHLVKMIVKAYEKEENGKSHDDPKSQE
jgi:phosphate starvation-inducible PhoH-like protein